MSNALLDYFETEKKNRLTEAKNIADAAAAEGRGVTDPEKARVDKLLVEAEDFKTRISGIRENETIRAAIDDMNGPVNQPNEETPVGAKSVGDAFVKSQGYKALLEGFKSNTLGEKWTTGSIDMPTVGTKTTVTEAASPVLQPQVEGGIAQAAAVALRPLTVANLLMQGTTNSATVRYLLETTITNAAAATDEGAAKPESAITFTQVDEPVRKVATFLPVSDEMLEDMAQIRSYLDNRLAMFVQQAEEAQLLSGSGTAPQIRGLLNRTGIQTGTRSALGTSAGNGAGASVLGDVFFQAITNIQVNALVDPDAIVVNPANWEAMRLAKDTAGQYLGGGPMIGAYGNGIQAPRLLGPAGRGHRCDPGEHGPRRCVRVDGAGLLPQQPRRGGQQRLQRLLPEEPDRDPCGAAPRPGRLPSAGVPRHHRPADRMSGKRWKVNEGTQVARGSTLHGAGEEFSATEDEIRADGLSTYVTEVRQQSHAEGREQGGCSPRGESPGGAGRPEGRRQEVREVGRVDSARLSHGGDQWQRS
jgi:HK97 family phage major capsid protein